MKKDKRALLKGKREQERIKSCWQMRCDNVFKPNYNMCDYKYEAIGIISKHTELSKKIPKALKTLAVEELKKTFLQENDYKAFYDYQEMFEDKQPEVEINKPKTYLSDELVRNWLCDRFGLNAYNFYNLMIKSLKEPKNDT